MRALLIGTAAVALTAAINGCCRPASNGDSTSTDASFVYEAVAGLPSSMGGAPSPGEFAAASPEERAGEFNTETYDRIYENPFLRVRHNPLSTFAIDVDTASYANVRRFLQEGRLPPPDAVRIEEFLNYFTYSYEPPDGEVPFSAHVELGPCPWKAKHRLARIGLKGKETTAEERPPANLVFLIDVSGSMNHPKKLPLLKTAMQMLVDELEDRDRVAIVVYAGASGLVLPPTSCEEKDRISNAVQRLQAGGSTNGGEGIRLAYLTANEQRDPECITRVILCTDGDFNVGVTNEGDLIRLVENEAAGGVFLTVLGFGMGNYKDSMLEKLADKGNGNYGYIDSGDEARKLLVEQLSGTLVTIAKDVKIQVDFNPTQVAAYRLIGYENRLLRNEDFRDDAKDAGEIGAGHTVTALYELVPAGEEIELSDAPESKYQKPTENSFAAESDEWLTLRVRYKEPTAGTSQELEFAAADRGTVLEEASDDFRFAAAVAAFGMLLRNSEHKGDADYGLVADLAESGRGDDPSPYCEEMVRLVKTAEALASQP